MIKSDGATVLPVWVSIFLLLSWECACALCVASSAWPVLVTPAAWSSPVQGRSYVQHTSWETPYSCCHRALVSPLCLPSHQPTSAAATLGDNSLLHRAMHAMGITLHLEGSLHRSDGVRQPTNWMRRRPRPRCGLCVFALQPYVSKWAFLCAPSVQAWLTLAWCACTCPGGASRGGGEEQAAAEASAGSWQAQVIPGVGGDPEASVRPFGCCCGCCRTTLPSPFVMSVHCPVSSPLFC